MRLRSIKFATIAVFGLGSFVAAAVGITLTMSGSASVRSAQTLLAERAETLLDGMERRLDARLGPVVDQAAWVAVNVADGRLRLDDARAVDAFMRGTLGTTPQVASVTLIDARGVSRRWTRNAREPQVEDWSVRPQIRDWLARGETQSGATWLPPLWAQRGQQTVLLHDMPLRHDGRFIGMFAQLVPVAALSRDLAEFADDAEVTPFILYGSDRVLAHPDLADATRQAARLDDPLPRLSEVGDPALERIGRPDSTSPFGLRRLSRAEAVAAQVGGEQRVFIYRDIYRFGPEELRIGVHLVPSRSDETAEMRRVVLSLIAGLVVLLLAVIAAAIAGRRISRPIYVFSRAARAVRAGRLADVPRLPRSAIREFDDASRSFNQMVDGLRERSVIRETLGRFVSEEVARGLLTGGGRLEPVEAEATVLLCDLEGFTPLTESLGAAGVVDFLNAYFEVMVGIVERYGGVITQFQGDAILAVFNVPIANPAHAANAVRAALDMVRATDGHDFAGVHARNRVGICTGALVAGAVGSRGRMSYTVHGNPVNLASRLEALNKDYGTRVLLAGQTAGAAGGIELRKVADAAIRGYGAPIELYTPRLDPPGSAA